ncbi:MAG: D-alanyl-D-alanine carboxypeptidase [Rhizobiaceae bacterium]|nr:D-alanyl-D-alanine carboxypeptidase [Rhizobiaceae bacterium]
MLRLILQIAAAMLTAGGLAACTTADVAPSVITTTTLPAMTSKHAVIVVDASNGKTLYSLDSELPRYPASLTKMMTLYMLFEALQQGRVDMTAQIPVSAYAAARPPTKIGFRPGETIDVESAIHALVIKSANDVAVAVGEYLGGTEERFASMMTAKARQLGMRGTTFRNASGLPDPEQRTTARDMALLGMTLRVRYPQYYRYFSETSFTFRGRTIRGHNDLLGRVQGVDGIKTGYVRDSGFNIVTSVDTEGRRMVAVVMGGQTARARNAEVEQLIERYLPQTAQSGGASLPAAPVHR